MVGHDDPEGIICKNEKGQAYLKIIKTVKEEPVMESKSFATPKKKPKTKSKKFNSLYQRKED